VQIPLEHEQQAEPALDSRSHWKTHTFTVGGWRRGESQAWERASA